MISDRDIRAAMVMIKSSGDDAMLEAAQRADQMLEEEVWPGAAMWHRILPIICRCHGRAPR